MNPASQSCILETLAEHGQMRVMELADPSMRIRSPSIRPVMPCNKQARFGGELVVFSC
jgi:hypothetical protein